MPGVRRTSEVGGEAGSVTAETAVALPALTVVLAAALWALAAVGAQIACIDAARVAARAASRGEELPRVRSAAERVAPDHARITVRRGDGLVRVTVRARVRPWGPLLADLPAATVRGRVTAAVEGS